MTPKGKRADFLTPAVRAGCGLAAEADEGERIVILSKWDPQCQKMAMRTGGLFQCVEPIEARDGQIALRAFAASSGSDLIAAVLSFAGDCCTGVKKHTNKFGNWSQGRGRPGAEETRLAALLRRLHEDANGSIADVLANLRSYPEVREYRRELLHTVISSLRDFDARLTGSTLEAFMQRRQAASRIGRSLARRSVGTPLLLKGLEFEHAVVVVDGQFSAKELYVALTRGTRSVTVVSAEPRVVPKTG
jgi:DNA helicase-2/ATP-dependent DNA helicase PcrA